MLSVSTILLITFVMWVSFSDPGFLAPGDLLEKEYEKNIPMASFKRKNYVLKYCDTCKLLRDFRVFHCSSCNLCVMRHGKILLLIFTFIKLFLRSSLSLAINMHRRFKS